jgi:hypothetical protein
LACAHSDHVAWVLRSFYLLTSLFGQILIGTSTELYRILVTITTAAVLVPVVLYRERVKFNRLVRLGAYSATIVDGIMHHAPKAFEPWYTKWLLWQQYASTMIICFVRAIKKRKSASSTPTPNLDRALNAIQKRKDSERRMWPNHQSSHDDGNDGHLLPSSHIPVFLSHPVVGPGLYITHLFLSNELSLLPPKSLGRRAWPSLAFAMLNAKQKRRLRHVLRLPCPPPRVVSSSLASLRLVTRRVHLQRRATIP